MTKKSPARALSISAHSTEATLSPAQKSFNRLLKQLEKKRATLAAWDALLPCYQKRYTGDFLPLDKQRRALQIAIVQRLDSYHGQKGFGKKDRRALSEVVLLLLDPILQAAADPELVAIYDRHSDSDYASDRAADEQMARDMLSEITGMNIDFDFDMNDPADFLQQMQKKLLEDGAPEPEASPARKKTAKQLAREAAAEAEEKDVSQALREVYRKLASALHPDRETDPDERERKNRLMQQVNLAYEKHNLLKLLELQLELEHIDASQLARLGEDKLKHFNRVLKEQSRELDMEILALQSRFMINFRCEIDDGSKPDQLLYGLELDLIRLQQSLHSIQRDLDNLTDAAAIKAFVRGTQDAMAERDMMRMFLEGNAF